jgi:hypothetical protein
MNITSMANFGFNVISNTYSGIKESSVKIFTDNGKVLTFANKIKKISNTAITFIKKNPKNITTGVGIASMIIGVTTANPGLVCVGVSALVAATLHTPPSVTSAPVHETNYPDAG